MLALRVHVSQYEVYNEQIYDLLAEDPGAILGSRPTLRLKEDSQGRIFVQGLAEVSLLYQSLSDGTYASRVATLLLHSCWDSRQTYQCLITLLAEHFLEIRT